MKKRFSVLIVLLTLIYSPKVFSQIDVNITDLKSNKTVPFSEIYETYHLDRELPTLVITWSGRWCYPCIKLIDRYNDCDLSMANIITINVDEEDALEEVLAAGHHLKWSNTYNFHANLGDDKKGFDNVFTVSSAPLILYLEDGRINDALINYSIFPYKLVGAGRINDVKFIWNSSLDLNDLAWNSYETVSSPAKLEEAKTWIIRSIELDKNYNNVDTYAALLFKTGEYTQALKSAKEAIEIAKENDIDYDSTTDLINKIIEKL